LFFMIWFLKGCPDWLARRRPLSSNTDFDYGLNQIEIDSKKNQYVWASLLASGLEAETMLLRTCYISGISVCFPCHRRLVFPCVEVVQSFLKIPSLKGFQTGMWWTRKKAQDRERPPDEVNHTK
jgi:hypothetical protein